MYADHQVNLMSQSKNRLASYRKLASVIIRAETSKTANKSSVQKTIESTLGVFYKVNVRPETETNLCISIDCEEEILEKNGLMQASVFNVLKAITQRHDLCIMHVENEFLPHYA